jgi:hypothetical protein
MSGAAYPGFTGTDPSEGRTVTTAVAPPTTGPASSRSSLQSLMAQLAGQVSRGTNAFPTAHQPYADAALAQVLMSIEGAAAGAGHADLQADIAALLGGGGGTVTAVSGSGEEDGRGAGRRRSKARRTDPEEEDEDYTEGEDERDGRRRGSRGNGGGPTSSGLGRPIAYSGDPLDEHLTEEERRRLKRRIANRESARRVRQKRQEQMEDLQGKVSALTHQNARLLSHIASAEQTRQGMQAQVMELREALAAKAAETSGLLAEAMALRKSLTDRGVDPAAVVAEALNGGRSSSGAAMAMANGMAAAPAPAPAHAPAAHAANGAPLPPGAAGGGASAFAPVQGIGGGRLPSRPGS